MPRALFGLAASLLLRSALGDWASAFESEGYSVQEGEYGFWGLKDCAAGPVCYAANPLTPYGLIFLPEHPNESATEVPYNNTCHSRLMCRRSQEGKLLSPGWRLAQDETVVVLGKTPPESAYWSFANSLFTRYNAPGWKPSPKNLASKIVACATPGSTGDRCESFSSVNDPLNHLTVNTTSGSFDADFALVLATDTAAESRTVAQLHANGMKSVNVLRFPGTPVLKLGAFTGAEDEMINVLRVEGIKDDAARDAYYSKPPLRAFRVTPPAGKIPPQPFPSFEGDMRPRATGVLEAAPGVSHQQLRAGLKRLKDAVTGRHSRRQDWESVSFASFVNDSGYECLSQGLRCQGDCRDTIYAKATFLVQEVLCNKTHLPCRPARKAELSEQAGDALFVVGVNHALTHQAVYTSLTGYTYPKLAPFELKLRGAGIDTLTGDQYQGSAAKYLPADEPTASYLYAVKFARKCDAEDFDLCVEVPSSNSTLILPFDTPVVFIERMYIRPGSTKSGPAVQETVLPELIHFRPWIGNIFRARNILV